MHGARLARATALIALVTSLSSCVYLPPVSDPSERDTAPFYFPDGIAPDPKVPVVIDLGDATPPTFDIDVFDYNLSDQLFFTWTLVFGNTSTQLISNDDQNDNTPGLSGEPLAETASFDIPEASLAFALCNPIFIDEDGDEAVLRLEVFDDIPAEQQIAEGFDRYTIVVEWNLVASGTCP